MYFLSDQNGGVVCGGGGAGGSGWTLIIRHLGFRQRERKGLCLRSLL